MKDFLNHLIQIANALDIKGLHREANALDQIIKAQLSEEEAEELKRQMRDIKPSDIFEEAHEYLFEGVYIPTEFRLVNAIDAEIDIALRKAGLPEIESAVFEKGQQNFEIKASTKEEIDKCKLVINKVLVALFNEDKVKSFGLRGTTIKQERRVEGE